jgi:hypothetical protein
MSSVLRKSPAIVALGLLVHVFIAEAAQAEYLPVFGGPIYPVRLSWDHAHVNNAGTAAGTVLLADRTDNWRAVRWDGSGAPPIEFEEDSAATSISGGGVIAGSKRVYSDDGLVNIGHRAMRWDAAGRATELGNLGTGADGRTDSWAVAINSSGTAVGYADKFDASGNQIGQRAVRWDALGTGAVELAFPSDSAYDGYSTAFDVNDSGVIIGWAGGSKGTRPVRWDASGKPTLLDSIGTSPEGPTGQAFAINNAGTAIGYGDLYPRGVYGNITAIRWDAGGTAATKLRGIGVDAHGAWWSHAGQGINDAGDIVGRAYKYDELGNRIGVLAVRWDAGSDVATELDHLGHRTGWASAINNAAVAVGYISAPVFETTYTAAYWLRDGSAVDLNTLIDPDSGWHLRFASDISDTGWITGVGHFDPDGPGTEESYVRQFLMHVPDAAIKEFAGKNLTYFNFLGLSVGGADFTAADARAATGLDLSGVVGTNLIRPDGRIDGLNLAAVEKLVAFAGVPIPVQITGNFSIAPGATFDLTNNAAIVDYAATSPAATVGELILTGRGGPGLGASWSGAGITSSTAATTNRVQPDSRSIGYAENAALPLGALTSFHGVKLDDTSILIAFTRTGDANLDGVVNDDDVTIVGATYAPGVPQPSWALGDFDYNGFVDDDDVTLLGAFYDPSAPLIVRPIVSAEDLRAVPEPASLALLAAAAAAVMCIQLRRRVAFGRHR